MKDTVKVRDLSGGIFFAKDRTAIPNNAARDCDRVMWLNRRLTRMPGFDKVNSSELNSGAVALGAINFRNDSNNLVAVFGNKLFEDCSTTTPSDVSGSLTLSATERVQFVEWKQGSNEYLIGVQKGSTPFKKVASTDGVVLGGSPNQCKWVEIYNNFVFMANSANRENYVERSDLSDPETWTTSTNFFQFPQEVTGLKAFKGDLWVFMPDRIGKVSGYGTDTFTQVNDFITTIGCISGYSVKPAKIFINGQDVDVLIFLAKDGLYAIDGSPNPIKLSIPIQKRFTGTVTERFAAGQLENAVAETVRKDGNYYVLSVGAPGASTNDSTYWVDLNKITRLEDGSFASAFWPASDTDAAVLVSRYNPTSADELYSLGTDGFVRLYDFADFTEDSSGTVAYWKSKNTDLDHTHQVREFRVLGEHNGSETILVSVNMTTSSGSESVTLAADGVPLDTFELDTDVLADGNFIIKNVSTQSWGQYMAVDIIQDSTTSDTADTDNFRLEGFDFKLKDIGNLSEYSA